MILAAIQWDKVSNSKLRKPTTFSSAFHCKIEGCSQCSVKVKVDMNHTAVGHLNVEYNGILKHHLCNITSRHKSGHERRLNN